MACPGRRPSRQLATRRRRRSAAPLLLALALLAVVAVGGAIALANIGGDDDPGPRAENTPRGDRVARARRTRADRGADGGADRGARPRRRRRPRPRSRRPRRRRRAEPTAASPTSNAPSSLQLEGYNARRAGDFQTALARSQAALEACGSARELSPCGFALFEQGAALNALGQYDAAVQALQQRLEVYGDNESGEVTKELKKAERNARKAGDEG